MLELATNQVHNRRRVRPPTLIAAIITHAGELSPGMLHLIESLTTAAASQYKPAPINFGEPRKTFTRKFRTRLKDAIVCANARGFGRALLAAGSPLGGWVINPSDWSVNY